MTDKKKYLFIAIAAVFALVFSLLPAPEGLDSTSMRFMGIFIAGIFLLIVNAVPDWAVFVTVASLLVLTKVTTFSTVYAQFSGSTIWLLVMVFALAAGIGNSGLLVRIAYKILSFFPASYKGAVMALMSASIVTAPLIPSGTAKTNILIPVGNQLTDTLGLEKNSRGAMGLFAAVFLPCFLGSQAFMTGSAAVGILLGMMGEEGVGYTMLGWLSNTILWFVVLVIGAYIFCAVICKPKQEQEFTKEFFRAKSRELGPMSFKEKVTAIVLTITIILWATTSITGFDTTMIGFIAVAALVVTGVMGSGDFIGKVPWTMIVFVGIVMSMSGIMNETGWNAWLASNLDGIVGAITGNVWIFVPVLTIMVYLLRFVIIESLTLLILLLPIFSPFMEAAGISMFLLVWIIFQSGYVLYAPYQCPAWMGTVQMADRISFAEIRKVTVAYIAINFIANMVSIPVWQMLGLC